MIKKVSVIIPAFNCAEFLAEAIESAQSQTVPPSEIIVVDDGSTDGTREVCGRFPGVIYLHQKNQGSAVARNLGWRSCTGEYVVFLDGDDRLLPMAVETGLAEFRNLPEAGFVFGRYDFYSLQPDGTYQVEERYENQPETASYATLLAARHKIQCACILFRRAAIEAAGGFNPALRVAQDIHFFQQVARQFPIRFHQTVVSQYRFNGKNISHNAAKMLIGTHRAHSLQEEFIRNSGNQEWEEAYEEGLGHWVKLFADRLPYDALRYLQTGDWAQAWGSLELVRFYDPTLKWVDRTIFESTWEALLDHLYAQPYQEDRDYWKKTLTGLSPLFALPTDRPRTVTPSFRPGSAEFQVPSGLLAQVSGAAPGVPASEVLLAAFQVLLHRYTGADDVVVGMPVTVETGFEPWVNGLVIRTDLSGNPGFPELVTRTRNTVESASAHRNLPFCLLADELVPRPDPSYSPVVQVTYGWEDPTELHRPLLTQLTATPWAARGQFDLSLYLKPSEAGLEGRWFYNSDLFDSPTIERLNGHFLTLLEGIAAAPGSTVGTIPMVTQPERTQLLTDWNKTPRELAPGRLVHELVADQAARTPGRVAVTFNGRNLTYSELDTKANQLARYLQKTGLRPDDMVGLYIDRSLEMFVGLLGILKSGASYVPIDPSFPDDRIEYMLENAEAKVLVTQKSLVPDWKMPRTQILCLDSDWDKVSLEEESCPSSTAGPDNVAYVIYTSGSTGKPKGVQVLHKGVVNLLVSMAKVPGVTQDDVVLSLATFSFDMSVPDLYLALTVGGRIVVISKDTTLDGKALARTITGEGVTLMQATPATWRLLLESGWKDGPHLRKICGGEALPKDLASELLAVGGELWNFYGPTETTVWSTAIQVTDADRRITVGKPIDDTQIYILDKFFQPVPIGVPGELCIGGIGVARGYWKRPELTQEKFIPNPYPKTGSDRIYRTGDLARYLPDGQIECLGRLDFQVKIRGFRIELGEIEAVLANHPGLNQSVVIVREDQPGNKRLVAYLVPKEGTTADAADLRAFLKESIPEYMVPSVFVVLEAFPLTPNGKVDRKALPVPEAEDQREESARRVRVLTSTSGGKQFTAPQDDFELTLVQLWEKALHTTAISMTDGFFELGGHSLLAVSLLKDINQTFQRELPLQVLFQAPTVRKLAQVLRDEGIDVHAAPLVKIQEGGNRPPLFCIYGIYLYYDLAKRLGKDQPVYGVYIKEEVDALGPAGGENPKLSVKDLSIRYLEIIRQQQPHGPYYLAGESMGGLVALEIAHLLREAGETVALVSLFDSSIPGRNKPSWRHRIKRHLDKFSQEGLHYVADRFKARVGPEEAAATEEERTRREFILQTIQDYKPRVYHGKALVFRALAEPHFHTMENWREYLVNGLEIFDVPGDHLSILKEPNVETLAAYLKDRMEKALAD